jgi:hypothetical protein
MGEPISGEATIQPWDSNHTALVHAFWAGTGEGVALDDFDELASFIMQSKWIAAVRIHASNRRAPSRA